MYIVPGHVKRDPASRWALPDRVFFAAGACHVLAYAFAERYPGCDFEPVWIRPAPGFTGNHIVQVSGDRAFDYHGYSCWRSLLDHTRRKAGRWWPGWRCELEPLPLDVLVSEEKSRTYDGLWLREPRQFLHDALPRAHAFLARFPPP